MVGLSHADLERITRTLTDNRLMLFCPSPALRPFMRDRAKRILVRAANRTGKTRHAAARLAQEMLDKPNGRFRAVGVTYQQSVSVVGRYLAEFLPPSELAPGCRYSLENGWTHQLIRLRNGATCEMRSQDQKAVAHAGSDLDGVWIDEPPPSDIFMESVTRVMARDGWVWVTMTPIGRPVQWFRDIVEAEDSEWVQYEVVMSPMNCPWYSADQVESWIEEARAFPDSFEQKIKGAWEGITSARTFTGWTSQQLLRGDLDEVLGGRPYTLGIGIDHGEGVGKQVAIFAVWTSEEVYVIDEIVNTEPTAPEQDARAILHRLGEWGWRLDEVRCIRGDVNSGGKLSGGRKVNELLTQELNLQAGFRRTAVEVTVPDKGRGSVEYGERLINNALLRGTLFIHDRCAKLVHSMRHYAGEEDLKHPVDALRYIVAPILADRTGVLPIHSRLRLNR